MKSIAVAVLMLLASANTLPTLSEDELRQERLIADVIINIINGVSQLIVRAGLDPFEIENAQRQFALFNPEVFSAVAYVQGFAFKGLSNVAIHNMDFSILASRLTFDVSLPKLSLSVGDSGLEVILLGREIKSHGSGSVEIEELRLRGEVRINLGVISGISVRSLDLWFSLKGIDSNLSLIIFGRDISEKCNNFLSNTLPNALHENQDKINKILEFIVLKIIGILL
ncbi:unnamed protein product [Parnassius apollo]|uniref:(apollo) hypothetical protein n=1 Tax=Parnassius apollo TaxID=110799 RepID=A0A8S3XJ72_PARAO|nr:unnamed protein product [Parnassius apollo]